MTNRLKMLTFKRDTLEFSRVISLSDGIFAIAMTLLVLTLDMQVWEGGIREGLFKIGPQLIVVMLSFGLVANLWWQHHKFVNMLNVFEPGLIVLNFVLLGAIALVPFPTGLIGIMPTSRLAIFLFFGLFIGITLVEILMFIRARSVEAWRYHITTKYFFWVAMSRIFGVIVMGVALVVALFYPFVGLGILAVTMALGPLASKIAYME